MIGAPFYPAVAVLAAPVSVTEVNWEFYQGGYVQADNETWEVWQDHYGGSPPRNVVTSTLGGATFESIAAMNIIEDDNGERFSFLATASFELSASVDADSPEGLAQSFGGLSAFSLAIEITDGPILFQYAGPELTWMGGEEPIESGSVIGPGTYSFWHNDPFPGSGYFWQTDMIGAGMSERLFGQVDMDFQFITVPTPAAISAMLGMLFVASCRRRRR